MDNPMIRVTRDAVTNLCALLGEDDDERLKLDMLEAETPLFDVVQLLLSGIEDDEGLIAALDVQIQLRINRKDRAKLRIEQRKALILSLMETAGVPKLPLPEATVWKSDRKGTLKVTDLDALPEGFFTEEPQPPKRVPDKAAIEAAAEQGQLPDGVQRTNGQTVLNIRRR